MAEYDALDRMSRTLRGSNPLPPRSPMGAMANDLGRSAPAPRPAAPSTALVLTAPSAAPPPAAPSTALVRTADVGNNGYRPNFTMGGNGPPARQMPEGLRPGEAAELSQNARAQAAARAQARATSGLLDEAGAATRAAYEAARPGVAPAPAAAPAPGATPSAAKPGLVARAAGAAGSGLRTAAGFAAKASNAAGGTVGAVQSLRDIGTGYRDHFAQSIGAEDAGPGWTAATDTLRTMANVGNALTGGLAESLGQGVSDYISGGSFTEGWKQPTSRDAFEAARGRPAGQPAAQTAGQPAAQTAGQSAAPSAGPGTNNPYADANARKIAESDAQNAAADAQAQGQQNRGAGGYDPNQSRPDLGYGPIGDRTKLTNEQAAIMAPAGRVTMTRGTDGAMEFSGGNVSGQVSYNDASGKALAGGGLRGKGFSNFDVAPAGADVVMGPGGYAFATSGSGVRGQGGGSAGGGSAGGGYTSDGIDTRGLRGPQADRYAAEVRQARAINEGEAQRRGSWENRVAQWNDPFSGIGKARRNMETSMAAAATTSSNKGMRGAGEKLAEARQAAYAELAKQHFGMAAGDRDDDTRRYTSDNSLRGSEASADATRYSADAQLGGKQMETQQKLRQQQLMSGIYQAAGGDPVKAAKLAASYGIDPQQFTAMAGTEQTRAKANSEDARSTFDNMFTDKDGKRDERAEAQAHQLASRIVPGWENMNPEQRNANRAKVVDAMRTVQGMNKLRNNGWGQAIGWDKPIPEYSQLPDLDGATVGDVGFWEGAARKDISKNDTKIALRNGEVRYLPAGTLSEAQLRMMQDNGATRSTR